MNAKIIEVISIIVCILIFISCVDVVLGGIEGEKALSGEVTRLIDNLGDKEHVYLDALWPSSTLIENKKIPISKVSPEVIEKSVYWIKTAIKKEWLPEDLQNRLITLKDFKKWEKRDKQGIVFSQGVGDYIIAEYETRNYKINIQENGRSLSLLIALPDTTDISQDPEGIIKKWIETFTNFPLQKSNRLTYQLQKADDVYYGKVLCDWEDKTADLLSGKTVISNMWWQHFNVCTDGTFFFISLPETDGTPVSLGSKSGLPDRF